MSDEESEDNGDFSASEDEWQPDKDGQKDQESSDFESEDDTDQEESFNSSPEKRKGKSNRRKANLPSSSLRSRMFNKYKPPPKTAGPSKPLSQNLSAILESSKFEKKKSISNSQNTQESDSESSGDDYLVDPNQLDLKSSFFDVNNKIDKKTEDKPPQFDCDGGMRLSDSEDDGEDEEKEPEVNLDPTQKKQTSAMIMKINQASSNQMNFSHLQEYSNNLEKAKHHLTTFKSDAFKDDKSFDVNKLLAMGEGSSNTDKKVQNAVKDETKAKKRMKPSHDSDSDWEDVQEADLPTQKPTSQSDLQITVQLPQNIPRQKATGDVDAMLKRKINHVIKVNQLYAHKASVLCQLAHGFYCNRSLNKPSLMAFVLKLLPNPNCYPNGRTEIKYFESIAKWYKTVMKLEKDTMYSGLKKAPPLSTSLTLQIKTKQAICKRDYVLIFIILLRAMGIQCRLVMNLVTLPLRPDQSQLCSLKQNKVTPTKLNTNKSKMGNSETISSSTSKKVNTPENEKKCGSLNAKTVDPKAISTTKPSQQKNSKTRSKSAKPETENAKAGKCSSTKDESESTTKTSRSSSKHVAENAEKPGKINATKSESVNPKKTGQSSSKSEPENDKKTDKSSSSKSKPEDAKKLEKSSSSKSETGNDKKSGKNSSKPESANSRKTVQSSSSKSQKQKITVSPYFLKSGNDKIEVPTTSATTSKGKKSSKQPAKDQIVISPHFLKKNFENNAEKEPAKTKEIPILSKNRETCATTKRKLLSLDPSQQNGGSIPQFDGADDEPKRSRRTPNLKRLKVPPERRTPPSDSDEEFSPSPPKKPRTAKPENKLVSKTKKIDRRVLSTDDEQGVKSNKKPTDIWVEVFSEKEEQWITIELFKSKVHCIDLIRKSATTPLAYVFAWNNDNSLKDVSPRYCPQWNTVTRKLRVEPDWLDEAIESYLGQKTSRDIAEDRELEKIHLDKPLPTVISEYKNHPLYALERHLLKFEGIYPPNALTLGFIRGEPVYARECVHTLHSREIWLKSARVVKPGETAYKIVKSRPKWDKYTSTVIKDQPLEIFGYWQTMEYDPPTAENGIVPRNAYGNVELFKACMLPKKTVHLQLPGLNRTCKKLNIDCAPAVNGFDFHSGSCHPTFDGFVVCEEYAEQVVEAWHKDQEEAERRENEKYLQRVYGNWKKLIKGLLIREKLKRKYNFQNLHNTPEKPKRSKK